MIRMIELYYRRRCYGSFLTNKSRCHARIVPKQLTLFTNSDIFHYNGDEENN